MNKRLLILLAASCISFQCLSQTAELTETIQKLQDLLGKVQTSSKTYEQEVKSLEYASIRYSFDEIDQKGAKISYAYEFNLSDIDPYAVRQETQKDVILVTLAVRNKQKLVKVYKNNEVQSFDDQVQMHARDIDNAREIVDLIKKTIPAAEKITADKLKLSNYDEMVSWLESNIKSVTIGAKTYTQSITKTDCVGSLKLMQVESDGKTSHEEQFIFNLSDVNLNSVNFKVTGTRFSLNFETVQKLKIISATRDAQVRPYVNEISINTNNVDEARDIKTVLAMVVPVAQEKIKADFPAVSNDQEAVQQLSSLVKDVRIGDKTQSQSIEPQCLASFTQVNPTGSASEKNLYTFNWIDIDPNGHRIQVTGDKMFMEISSKDKKPVITHFKNDKFDGYENEIKISADNYETGRRLKYAIDKTIEKCKTSYKEPFSDNSGDIVSWLQKTIGEVTVDEASIKQVFEPVTPDNLNKVKFTVISVKGSTSSEEVFEFNFSDINPVSVDVQVKGKWLYVKFETNFKGKIIKAYKDGKIQPYASSIEIAVKDIETARGVMSGLKKCIEAFKAK